MKNIKKLDIIFFISFAFFMFYKPIICILLIGSMIIFHSINYAIFLSRINRFGKETIGKILSYETEYKGYKTPIIEFEVETKKIKEKPFFYASTDLSKIRSYSNNIDKLVPILYIPSNPKEFIMKSEKKFNYGSLIFISIIGLIFIIISLAQLLNLITINGMS